MIVPRRVEELHEADAAFDHPAGEQAVAAEGTCRFAFETVHVPGGGGLVAGIEQLPGRRLACGTPTRSWQCALTISRSPVRISCI